VGDNNKNKKNKNEIKIITDKLKNSEYTFVDGSLAKSSTTLPLNRVVIAVYRASSCDVMGFPKSAIALYNPSLSPMYTKTAHAAPPKSESTFPINC
jgi:hypothetical protein